MPELISCNLCGSDDVTLLFETYDRLLHVTGNYRFVRCKVCGLVYVNPQPTWDERAAHYPPIYRGYHFLKTESSLLQRLGIMYGLHKHYRIIANHLRNGRLLDVGCGGGDFLHWVRRQPGWQVYGLERPAQIALAAYRFYTLNIVQGSLMHLSFAPGFFDVVTLWTVLEHVSNPLQGLKECARVLRSGGLLVVRTVTLDSWSARFFSSSWIGYDAPRILFTFSRYTLSQMLLEAGFDVLDMRCYFHDFHPFLWSWHNLCESYLGSLFLCQLVDKIAGSWPIRLLTLPFFALQTHLGGNSFVTTVARKF